MKLEKNPGKVREREFSCLRNQKSRRQDMSKSNITYSHAHNQQADLSKSFIRQLDNQYDNGLVLSAHTKQRNYHNLSESGITGKNQELKKSKILCAGCFNKEIKSNKDSKNKGKKEQQTYHHSLIDQNDDYHKNLKSCYHNQYQKVNQYNLSIIKKHEKDKIKKNEARKKEIEQAGQKYQQNKTKEAQNFEELVKKRQLFRQQLQKQIENRKSRNKAVTEQNGPNDGLFKGKERDNDIRDKKQSDYRNALKQQINENRQRNQVKKINDQKQKKEANLETLKYVAEQQKKKREKVRKRQALKEEADRFIKQKNERKFQRQNQEKQLQQDARIRQTEIQQKQKKQRKEQHKTKLDKYLGELKEQMKLQKVRKQEEHRKLYEAQNIALLKPEKKKNTRQCECCEHQYPKSYLTKYHPQKFLVGA